MVLKCKLCRNSPNDFIEFIAEGRRTSEIKDTIDSMGRIIRLDHFSDHKTTYSKLECSKCGAETEDIEGAEEWLKQKNP